MSNKKLAPMAWFLALLLGLMPIVGCEVGGDSGSYEGETEEAAEETVPDDDDDVEEDDDEDEDEDDDDDDD